MTFFKALGALLLTASLTCAVLSGSALNLPTGQVDPADLTGSPGDTLIWGVTLINTDSLNWWVINSIQSTYSSSGIPGEIPNGAGFFIDDLSPYFFNNFVASGFALAPGQDINLASPGDPLNLAEFSISPTASAGTIYGQLLIEYDIYDANPFDANTPGNYIASREFNIDTSVTALAQEGSPGNPPATAPEPASWLLLAAGAACMLKLRGVRS